MKHLVNLEFIVLFAVAACISSTLASQGTPDGSVARQTQSPEVSEQPSASPTTSVSNQPQMLPRGTDGDGALTISGERKTWHRISLTVAGPWAHEYDNRPNPFLDYRVECNFRNEDNTEYLVPGYFAADGNAAETSAKSGNCWRVNFAPDRTGTWNYEFKIYRGEKIAVEESPTLPEPTLIKSGSFDVGPSEKVGRDFRHQGRLQYTGQRYLKFAETGKPFIKVGADSPETLLAYSEFDGTIAAKPKVGLKSFEAHQADWSNGDPIWQSSKGKGLIGAINYLSDIGGNAFSFLTYNAGGDGDNVWPFVQRDDKLHYDCSKLDQWAIVFDHATTKGMFLHFKLQETEIDDNRIGKNKKLVRESLDGGRLGIQRKLYLRELIARFGHNLACNWNLGEENSMSPDEQTEMIRYIRQTDCYDHAVVVHTFPNQQDKVYGPFVGKPTGLTGLSLQNNHINQTHWQTVKWVRQSQRSGHPWIVSFDEAGSAGHGTCPDIGYDGFDGRDKTGKMIYTPDDVRKQALWGQLMGGGAGVEYYFGYKFAQNDLHCEDWRSREQSWKYCRIAVDFLSSNDVPIDQMQPMDELVGNTKNDNSVYCLAKPGAQYLIYLPTAGLVNLDLTGQGGVYSVNRFNPRIGGPLQRIDAEITGGQNVRVDCGVDDGQDWLLLITNKDL